MTNTTNTLNLDFAVGATAHRLQRHYLGQEGDRNRATARGILAELRRNAGAPAEKDPLALERIHTILIPALSPGETGQQDAPSPSEEAAYTALSLFALHMQGATGPAHVEGVSFAATCGRLNSLGESASFKPRFDAMLVSQHAPSRAIHLRALVTLLRAKNLAFDYGNFARDLRSLNNPKRRAGVLLRWGRDFARGGYNQPTSTTEMDA